MDPDSLASSIKKAPPRTMRFKPKALVKKEPKLVLPKVEKSENDLDDIKSEELLNKLKEINIKKPRFEKKATTFDFGGLSSSYGAHKIKKNQASSSNGNEGQAVKEYKEPWDYYTNYPVTLPIRRPYSGNPELLDEEEFGPESSAYDEDETNIAEELGLLDEDEDVEDNKLFIQLPKNLPALAQSEVGDANPAKGSGTSKGPCGVESLPSGLIGKLLVYRSGKVKLKLGDNLFDVSLGLNCTFAQDVVAINPESKHCCNLGELNKRAVVTPDIDSMLDSVDEDDL